MVLGYFKPKIIMYIGVPVLIGTVGVAIAVTQLGGGSSTPVPTSGSNLETLATLSPPPTDTPIPTLAATFPPPPDTPKPPKPTSKRPSPTYTPEPSPTYTPEPSPTYTPEPSPTATVVPPTATPTIVPTPIPEPTSTPKPLPTFTPEPLPTNTPEPLPTNTPEPTPLPLEDKICRVELEDVNSVYTKFQQYNHYFKAIFTECNGTDTVLTDIKLTYDQLENDFPVPKILDLSDIEIKANGEHTIEKAFQTKDSILEGILSYSRINTQGEEVTEKIHHRILCTAR